MAKEPSLENAYSLETPDDNIRLYRDWAETYDEGFAAAEGYTYADDVAALFAARAKDAHRPILDIGAGTGLVGAALAKSGLTDLEALDISAEMLAEAGKKAIYDDLHCVDLTDCGDFGQGQYGGVISAGTFTHGHLGPEALMTVVDLGKPGALFALGINSEHFESRGFAATLADMSARITTPELVKRPIYGQGEGSAHSADTALIALFSLR